jgi:hypothetical protein
MEELFIKASRAKLRFKAPFGNVTVEDLWDLTLENLNSLAKALNKALKDMAEEDYIKVKPAANKEMEMGFEIVKYVINTKLEEATARKLASDKKLLKQKIMGLMEDKKDQALSAKSLEELQAELDKLD